MPLHFSDVLDLLETRAERFGLVSRTEQKADTAELEIYMFQALLDITESVDIPAYLKRDQAIAITTAGQPDYPLPADFGRLILPRVQNRRGIYLYDTIRNVDLEYVDPNVFTRRSSFRNERPTQFTIIERRLWLYPTPDGNGTSDYTVRGLYMHVIDRPELDHEVPLSYPTALVDVALFRLASDAGKQVQALTATRTESMERLAAGGRSGE